MGETEMHGSCCSMFCRRTPLTLTEQGCLFCLLPLDASVPQGAPKHLQRDLMESLPDPFVLHVPVGGM